jgi:hypothetical protein
LVSRADHRWVVETTGLEIVQLGMSRRRGIKRRAAVRTEMPCQRVAAVAGFSETSGGSPENAEMPSVDADADIERASGAPPAIGAVAIIGGAWLAVAFVADRPAQAAAGYFRHPRPHVSVVSSCQKRQLRSYANPGLIGGPGGIFLQNRRV